MPPKRRCKARKRAPRNHAKLFTVTIEDPYRGKKKDKERVVVYSLSYIDEKYKDEEPMGTLSIDVNKKVNGKLYNMVRYADLDVSLHNKGYGKLLYQTALFHLGSIATFYHEASDKAKRVWHSLMRDFCSKENFFDQILIIKKRRRRFSVHKKL
jgi:hypothetical protein